MKANEKIQIFISREVKSEYVVHIRGEIEAFEDYVEVFETLSNISENDTLTVVLNTPGGCCSTGWALIDAIQEVPCPVLMHVSYPTYSMGALLAMCGDFLTIAEDSYIMFHDFSTSTRGKGGDMALYINNYREVFIKRFNKLAQPFLTKKECRDMFAGLDIYIHDNSPELKERVKRHFKQPKEV